MKTILSSNLINSFSKIVTAKEESKDELIVYGMVTEVTVGGAIVRLDGVTDDTLTPATTTVTVAKGDRVIVSITKHNAIITGNVTENPVTLAGVKKETAEVQKVLTNYVESNFVATDYLQANYIDVGYLDANFANIDELKASYATLDDLVSSYVETGKLGAEIASIGYLKADSATITDLQSDTAKIHNFAADQISSTIAYIDGLEASNVTADRISSNTAYIKELESKEITASNIVSDHATISELGTTYANIDFSNVNTENVEKSFIQDLVVRGEFVANEGTIFKLTNVHIDAADITTGTLRVDRLLVKRETENEDGTKTEGYYLLNTNSHIDETTGETINNIEYVKMDGDVLKESTITGEKIVAGTITAEQITASNINGICGWINLSEGKFAYTNTGSADLFETGIAWDGKDLTIKGDIFLSSGESISDAIQKSVSVADNNIRLDFTDTINNVNSTFKFSTDGLDILKTGDSKIYSHQDNESYEFREQINDGTENTIMKITPSGVTELENRVTGELEIGAGTVDNYIGQWAIRKGKNQTLDGSKYNMNIVWIGG